MTKPVGKKIPHSVRVQLDKYARRATLVGKYTLQKPGTIRKAKSGTLTPAEKGLITRRFNSLKGNIRRERQGREVFVRVKSRYRRKRSVETGQVTGSTSRGVFVSVNRAQIEKTGIDRLRVGVGRGGSVRIRYGSADVETVAIDKIAFARNPAKQIRRIFKKRGARSLSVMINGFEAGGMRDGKMVDSQQWEQYTNDLLRSIEDDMMKADQRRTRKSVKEHLAEHIAFRLYYGKDVLPPTISPQEFMRRYSPEEVNLEDMEDFSDDEE